jgi:beta-D-xylosidase 4
VLLKNEGGRLPLRTEKVRKLALIGPHANGSVIFLGGPNYHGDNELVLSNTPLLRAKAKLPAAEVAFVEGCNVSCPSRSEFAAATAAASAADTGANPLSWHPHNFCLEEELISR